MSLINCSEAREEFAAYDRGECSVEMARAVDAHLENCAPCREVRMLDARIDDLLQSEEMTLAAPGFEERVRAAVLAQPIQPLRRWRVWSRSAALAAAGILLAFGVVKFVIRGDDDDTDVIDHLDVVETLAILHDAIPAGEAAVDFDLRNMNNQTLEAFLKAQNEENN